MQRTGSIGRTWQVYLVHKKKRQEEPDDADDDDDDDDNCWCHCYYLLKLWL